MIARVKFLFIVILFFNAIVVFASSSPINFNRIVISQENIDRLRQDLSNALKKLQKIDAALAPPYKEYVEKLQAVDNKLSQIGKDLAEAIIKKDSNAFAQLEKELETTKLERQKIEETIERTWGELPPLISSEDIVAVKNIWAQLLYVFTHFEGVDLFADKVPTAIHNKLQLYLHPDKVNYHIQKHQEMISDLRAYFDSWDSVPELKIVIRQQRFIRHLEKLKITHCDKDLSVIPQSEINTARKLWYDLASMDMNERSLNKFRCLGNMDKKFQNVAKNCLQANKWKNKENQKKIALLLNLVKKESEFIDLVRVYEQQDLLISLLEKLNSTKDKTEKPWLEFQIQKMWANLISFDSANGQLEDMDFKFKARVASFKTTIGSAVDGGSDESAIIIANIFDIMNSSERTAKILLRYKPQNDFIDHLKKLQKLDKEKKVIPKTEVIKLRALWNNVSKSYGADEEFFKRIPWGEDFRIVIGSYAFPDGWGMPDNRTEIVDFFKNENIFGSHAHTIVTKPANQSLIEEFKWAMRPLIDPSHYYANAVFTPEALKARVKRFALNLETFCISPSHVITEEAQRIVSQMKLLKQFYNYNWLDRILHPYHNDIAQLRKYFPQDKEKQKKGLKEIQAKLPYCLRNEPSTQENINTICKTIELITTDINVRPEKTHNMFLVNNVAQIGLSVINKIVPQALPKGALYEKSAFVQDKKVQYYKNSLNRSKQALAMKMHNFKSILN